MNPVHPMHPMHPIYPMHPMYPMYPMHPGSAGTAEYDMERGYGHWQARLPAELVEQVVWPVRMQAFHDDALPASKWRGYDALGLLCYCRQVCSSWSAGFDEAAEGNGVGDSGQVPCELQQQEDLEAWRTLLGTWVRRVQRMRRTGAALQGQGQGQEQAQEQPNDDAAEDSVLIDTDFELVTARAMKRL